MLSGLPPLNRKERGSASLHLPLILGVAAALGFVGLMMGAMAMWDGDHMGMMRRGSAGLDQTPVVSDSQEVTVEMRDYEFFPAKLTVNAGAEVSWLNGDAVPHDAVAADGAFDTGRLDGGETGSVVRDLPPGTYSYVCTYHPGMEGTITVR